LTQVFIEYAEYRKQGTREEQRETQAPVYSVKCQASRTRRKVGYNQPMLEVDRVFLEASSQSRQSAILNNKRTLKIRTLPIHGLAGSKAGAPDASGPEPAASVRSHRDLWANLLLGLVLAAPRAEAQQAASGDLALRSQRAAAVLSNHQQAQGYWLTSYTNQARFERPRPEMNTFVTSVIIDLVNPVAAAAGLEKSLQRARNHLAGQIEDGGLVRYHGRPDAPTIGTLGCRITPDADDTSLVWRIAPGAHRELLPPALATIRQYRTPEGLYRTWLAPRDRFECIDPGKDPNPADVAIQMHVLLLLAQADPPAARALCSALGRAISEDRIWVYYRAAPLIPFLRQADLQRAGCALRLPSSRLQTAMPGQEVWAAAGQMLQRLLGAHRGASGPAPTSVDVRDLLQRLSRDDFSSLRQTPPLLYHNDFTASVPRFYWSVDFGYALWLRLYFENAARS
jgi:hypothetical protein